MTDFE